MKFSSMEKLTHKLILKGEAETHSCNLSTRLNHSFHNYSSSGMRVIEQVTARSVSRFYSNFADIGYLGRSASSGKGMNAISIPKPPCQTHYGRKPGIKKRFIVHLRG
jgi:hypothetical protein